MKSGTSFDPSLNGELRVTVVATGLDGVRARQQQEADVVKPARVPGQTSHNGYGHGGSQPHNVVTPLWSNGVKGARPHEAEGASQPRAARPMSSGLAALELNEELLDIPAFLRAQAD